MSTPLTIQDLTDEEAVLLIGYRKLPPDRQEAMLELAGLLANIGQAEESGAGLSEAIEALAVFATGPYGTLDLRDYVAELRAKHAGAT